MLIAVMPSVIIVSVVAPSAQCKKITAVMYECSN